MVNKVLELEETDDLTAIRSRVDLAMVNLRRQSVQAVDQAEPIRLLLVVPRQNETLRSLVNMKLLARQAAARLVEVAVVSMNPTVRDNAKSAGLKTFPALKLAKWAGWMTEETEVIGPDQTDPPLVLTGQTVPGLGTAPLPKRKRVKKKKYKVVQGEARHPLVRSAEQVGSAVLIGVLALILVFGVLALLPQATVTLTPVAQPVETELIVKADPDATSVNFQELSFPARIEQVELALFDEIPTVKTELAPVGLATGRVVFINRTESEVLIPFSTTVAATAGQPIEFGTTITTVVPPGIGATSPPVSIVALEPGPVGNVAAGQINRVVDGGVSPAVRVINEEWTSGGSEQPARIVEEADKDRLNEYLLERLQEEGVKQLQEQMVEQEFIVPDSVEVLPLDLKYREFSGEFSDTFGGEMQAVVRATVIGGYNANRLALAGLEAQVPPGYELDLNGLRFSAGEILEIQGRVVTFKIFASGQVVPIIDEVSVSQAVAGLSIGQAQQQLEQQYALATVPGVDLQPAWLVDWLGRLPFTAFRIEVVVNEAVTLMAEGG